MIVARGFQHVVVAVRKHGQLVARPEAVERGGTYETAADLMGVVPEEVLFIANHAFDCIGAKATGMRAAFIDRRCRPFGATPHQPDLIVPNMTDLADLIA